MKPISARYAGRCKACKNRFPVGEVILWDRKHGTFHSGGLCEETAWGIIMQEKEAAEHKAAYDAEAEMERRQMARENAEYAAGVADAERYIQDRQMFGDELAEQWQMDHELHLYNTGQDY